MATVASNVLTLADWAKRIEPSGGKVSEIVEILNQSNEILMDMLFMEGNLPTGHRTTIRTGLPLVYWRLLNMGIPSSKSRTAQVDEGCGMLEAYSEVDVDLAELSGDVGGFRESESVAFLEAMNQTMASTLFYGNASVNPEQFNGLAVRYSSLSAPNSQNIISGAGAGSDNASIWLVAWGKNTIFGVFPKASKAGITQKDLGEVTLETTAGVAGSRMQAYREHFQWKNGLALRDWRYVVRICNIDISNLTGETSAADLTKLMIKAVHRIPFMNMGKPCFYMNRTVFQMLDIQRWENLGGGQSGNAGGGGISYDTIDGKSVPTFRGIPIRICDALLTTEGPVT
jgi:hypothetical protein